MQFQMNYLAPYKSVRIFVVGPITDFTIELIDMIKTRVDGTFLKPFQA